MEKTMRCSHCQTELPDSAISCSHCGQSTHREGTAYFSYLPTGTPPWPTTIPSRLSTANALALSAQSAATTSKQHHRRSASGTLLIIAILILTPLIGVGLTLGTFYMQGGFS